MGPYALESVLGRGGGGVVYLARGPEGEQVAVKRLKATAPESLWARFEREIEIQRRLSDPGGFVPVLASGRDTLGPWLALPYMAGGSLRERLASEGQLSQEEVLRIGLALSAALGGAHALGFVHRDLKPENLLFDAEGQLFVADLGVARLRAGDKELGFSRSLSRTGELRGTLAYLAPECVVDSKHASPRADVFSCGCVLYECATGEPAFQGQTMVDLLAAIGKGNYVPPRSLAPGLAPGLCAVIERCLSPEPKRYPDGEALRAALAACVDGPRRRGVLASAIAIAILSAFALGAWTLTHNRAKIPERPSPDTLGVLTSAVPTAAPLVPAGLSVEELIVRSEQRLSLNREQRHAAAKEAFRRDPRMGRASLAVAKVELELERYDDTETSAKRAAELLQGSPLPWLVAAKAARASDEWSRVLSYADLGLARIADMERPLPWAAVSALHQLLSLRADAQAKLGRLRPALDTYARLLRLNSGNTLYLRSRAEIYRRLGELERAEAELTPVLQRHEIASFRDLLLLAEIRHERGDRVGSFEVVERLLARPKLTDSDRAAAEALKAELRAGR